MDFFSGISFASLLFQINLETQTKQNKKNQYFFSSYLIIYKYSFLFSGAQKPKTQIQPQQMIRPPFYLNQQQLQTLQYLQQLNPLNPQQQQLLHQLQHQFRMMQQHQHQQRQQQVRKL